MKKLKEASNGEAIGAIGAIMAPSVLDPVTRTWSYARTAHYYDPFANRLNYHLLIGHWAIEILSQNGSELEATGVKIVKRGSSEEVVVSKKRSQRCRWSVVDPLVTTALWCRSRDCVE